MEEGEFSFMYASESDDSISLENEVKPKMIMLENCEQPEKLELYLERHENRVSTTPLREISIFQDNAEKSITVWIKSHRTDKRFKDLKQIIAALRSQGISTIRDAIFDGVPCWLSN